MATAEASSNLARYDGVRYTARARLAPGDDLATLYERTRGEHFGAEVKRRIMLGTYVLSAGYYEAYYLKAQRVRTLIRRDYDTAFAADVDAIAMPTCPTPAFRLGERADDPLQMYLADVFTVSANLTGLPAISVPVRLLAGSAADRPAADRPAVRRGRPAGASRTPTSRRRLASRGARSSVRRQVAELRKLATAAAGVPDRLRGATGRSQFNTKLSGGGVEPATGTFITNALPSGSGAT